MPDSARPAGFSLEDAVLDIGGDIGALILYTNADLAGREIEVSRIDELDPGHDERMSTTAGTNTGPSLTTCTGRAMRTGSTRRSTNVAPVEP